MLHSISLLNLYTFGILCSASFSLASPAFLIPTKKSTFSLNMSLPLNLSTTPRPSCNGRKYGNNLRVASCLDAFEQIPSGTRQLSVGMRESGPFDISLPFRWLSGDGLCMFDIAKEEGTRFDLATTEELQRAARALKDQCLANGGTKGGLVINLGLTKQLGLQMTSYAPSVRCEGTTGPSLETSCYSIIAGMPASADNELVFGGNDEQGVDVHIPDSFHSHDQRCSITVASAGPKDTITWYELWEAARAIDGMCGTNGQSGTAYGLGEEGRLIVDLRKSNELAEGSRGYPGSIA